MSEQLISEIAFYAWCAAQLAAFVACWLLWRSRERWRKAALAHKPRRALKAKTVFMPMFHAPKDDVYVVTDEDIE
jgi:ABC-type nickel/cobalt efflux system permease component RcnA